MKRDKRINKREREKGEAGEEEGRIRRERAEEDR